MAAPLVDRNTGDIIPASDHNDVKDYIEDGTYRVNTLSLNIGGTEIIDSTRNIAYAEAAPHVIGTAGQSAILSADITATGAIANGSIVTFTDGDTTPTVTGSNTFKTSNSTPTTITNFDDGVTSQHICVIINDANTTIQNGATISTSDGNNITPQVGDAIDFVLDGTVWREHHRTKLKNAFFVVGTGNYGAYRVASVAANADGYFSLHVPDDFVSLVNVELYCIVDPSAAQTARDIDFDTAYATEGEAYNTHTASDTTSTYDLSTSSNQIYAFNLNALFASLAGNDSAGIHVKHNSIGGALYYLGVELYYLGDD